MVSFNTRLNETLLVSVNEAVCVAVKEQPLLVSFAEKVWLLERFVAVRETEVVLVVDLDLDEEPAE